jgi:septal ring factor EnvC (AmiA/AmiB activator)
MKRLIQGAIVATVAALGIWGCAQDPAGQAAERFRNLEAKHARLEGDFKTVCAARDQLRRKLASAEEAAARAEEQARQLAEAERQRDEARSELKTRTDERDAAWGQYDSFRRNVRDLLGRSEASLPSRPADTASRPASVPTRLTSGTGEPPAPQVGSPSTLEQIGPPLTASDS